MTKNFPSHFLETNQLNRHIEKTNIFVKGLNGVILKNRHKNKQYNIIKVDTERKCLKWQKMSTIKIENDKIRMYSFDKIKMYK